MKRYLDFIKEEFSYETKQTVMFGPLIDKMGVEELVNVLNIIAVKKRVFFIGDNGKIFDHDGDGWITADYKEFGKSNIFVHMSNGQGGRPTGLIYFDSEPFNFGKFKKIENPDIDPYGEDDWGYAIIEEAKLNTEYRLTRWMDGISPMGLMKGDFEKESRDAMLIWTRNLINKKVQFYNLKDGKSTKKDRIIEGIYWKENKDNPFGWDLIFTGTKKDYVVNVQRPIGILDKYNKSLNLELDPYGEEDWGILESVDYEPFREGDRVLITKKKSKNRNRTGTITYLEYVSKQWYLNFAEVTLDYDNKIVGISLANLEKLPSVTKVTEQDPYGEEDWSEEY